MSTFPEPPFFLVWREGGEQRPTKQHDSYESADAEAARLARLIPGIAFYVLVPCRRVIKSDVDRLDYAVGLDTELPF